MTRGLRLMSANAAGEDPKSLWMALATSLHLDVVRSLGDEIDRPYREMVAVNNVVDLTIRQRFKYHRSSRPLSAPGWGKDADEALEKLRERLRALAGRCASPLCHPPWRRPAHQDDNFPQAPRSLLWSLGG